MLNVFDSNASNIQYFIFFLIFHTFKKTFWKCPHFPYVLKINWILPLYCINFHSSSIIPLIFFWYWLIARLFSSKSTSCLIFLTLSLSLFTMDLFLNSCFIKLIFTLDLLLSWCRRKLDNWKLSSRTENSKYVLKGSQNR